MLTTQPEDTLSKPNNPTAIIGIVLVMLIPFALGRLLAMFHVGDVQQVVYSRLVFWTEVGLLYLYALKAERRPFVVWDEAYPTPFYFHSVGLLYLSALGAGFISAIPMLFGWHDNEAILTKWVHVITSRYWLLLFSAITAGVTEELVFRGYLQTRLQMLFKNAYMPIIISAILFAALHYRYFNLREIIFAFLIGAIFAIHYQKYRNIHVLIITHFLIDFISFLISRQVGLHHIEKAVFGMF